MAKPTRRVRKARTARSLVQDRRLVAVSEKQRHEIAHIKEITGADADTIRETVKEVGHSRPKVMEALKTRGFVTRVKENLKAGVRVIAGPPAAKYEVGDSVKVEIGATKDGKPKFKRGKITHAGAWDKTLETYLYEVDGKTEKIPEGKITKA